MDAQIKAPRKDLTMLGKVKLFLLTLVAMVGLAVPALAATSPVATTITEFSLTNLNKEAITRVNTNSDFYIKVGWKVTQEDANVHNGDYLELQMPTQLKFPSTEGTTFPIYAPDGAEMGTANVIAGNPGRVRITFNSWVENKSDIRGTLWLAAHMKAGTPEGDQTLSVVDLNTHFSNDLSISAYTDGELNDENIAKWGVKTDHNTVLWKVRINNAGTTLHNVNLTDTIENSSTYVPGSFRIYRVMMDNKGNVLPTPGWVKITDTTTKPVIAEDSHSFTWDLSALPFDENNMYWIEYETTFADHIDNSIKLTSAERTRSSAWSYVAANSGGNGTGVVNPDDPATPETPETPETPGNTDNGNTETPGDNNNPNPDNPVTPVNPDEPVNPQPQPQPNPEPQPTPEPENPPTPSNPDTPVVPDNPNPDNPVNPQPENPTNPVSPEPNKPDVPVKPNETPSEPSEDAPKQSEQKKSTHTKKVAILPNTGDNATSIAMLGGMILFGLTTIATARKMRR
jgi:LPXTG-motif cell wall-anchored protein